VAAALFFTPLVNTRNVEAQKCSVQLVAYEYIARIGHVFCGFNKELFSFLLLQCNTVGPNHF
jgi:hypothetical protein